MSQNEVIEKMVIVFVLGPPGKIDSSVYVAVHS